MLDCTLNNLYVFFFFRKCVPQENHNRLKKQWKDLYRRHSEFRKCLIGGGVANVPIGDMMFTSFNMTHDATFLPNYSFNEEVSVSFFFFWW